MLSFAWCWNVLQQSWQTKTNNLSSIRFDSWLDTVRGLGPSGEHTHRNTLSLPHQLSLEGVLVRDKISSDVLIFLIAEPNCPLLVTSDISTSRAREHNLTWAVKQHVTGSVKDLYASQSAMNTLRESNTYDSLFGAHLVTSNPFCSKTINKRTSSSSWVY